MIYTLTISPAIDYHMYLSQLKVDEINKSKVEEFFAGGKGINVSFVLKALGYESICLGFLGGINGKFIANELDKQNIKHDFVWTDVNTRINVKISANSGETAIDATGEKVKEKYLKELLYKTKQLKKDDILVLSGNTCKGVQEDIYDRILSELDEDVIVVVDTVRELFRSTLKYRPFFVKPNILELEEILGVTIESDNDLVMAAKKIQEMGARNVIVTLGEKGAYVLMENKEDAFIAIPKSVYENNKLVNTIGCGDATVAGTIYQYLETKDFIEAVKYGIASGTACAYTSRFANKKDICEMYRIIR